MTNLAGYIATCIAIYGTYIFGVSQGWLVAGKNLIFISIVLFCMIVHYYVRLAKRGENLYLRPIAGINKIEEAVGRATEMGKSVLFVPGIMDLDQVETVAGLVVLSKVSYLSAQYETKLNVPTATPIVMESAKETCYESYLQAGRPHLYHDDIVHFITNDQFGYAAGVDGIMVREKPAACFYQGKFFAESLILAETGNAIGAMQIAGTGSSAQIPFFVVACDYTLIGEEFFAASAYYSKDKELIGALKGQDIFKLGLIILIIAIFISNLLYQLGWISSDLIELINTGDLK